MAKFLSWQLPISKFSSLQVYMCMLKFTHAHCQLSKFAILHVHNAKCPSLQAYMCTLSSSHLHIAKFPTMQNDKCTLLVYNFISAHWQIHKSTCAHCQMHKLTRAYCQNYMCTLPNAQWRTPKLFNGLIASPKVKTVEGKKVGAHSLARNTSGVEGRARVSGLGRLTSNSITHTNLHKPNNKLVNA
jgi:hypothetical protein